MEARVARFDEEDQLKKLRTQKVQERNAKLEALGKQSSKTGNKSVKEPACWAMCPEFEMIDRQVTNDVSLFEAQIPFNPPNGKLIIDPRRAVKKFRRSAAGNYELSEDLRPPEILLATTVYLMREVLGDGRWSSNGVSFSVLYAFIRDRLRAIRTDLTLQACKTLHSIRIHELSIRFLIAAGHLLCEEDRAAFEPQQNTEQLNGCLSALREMYKAVRIANNGASDSQLLKYEAEFQAYAIILSVDKKEAAIAISSLPIDLLSNQQIQVALEAYSAFQQSNFIKFLSLIRKDSRTSYFQACLLHQFILPVRQRALNALITVADCYKMILKDDFVRWLAFVDNDELIYYSDRFGFTFANNNFVDLTSLAARGEAIDLRAEEENFRIRRFQVHIEDQRRASPGLHEIIFKDFDLNPSDIMKILTKKAEGITSEFLLAASSSSPLPNKKEPVKKFFTASRLASLSESSNNLAFTNELPSKGVTSSVPEVINSAPEPPTIIDHQAILRKKLEAQAQEREKRKELISDLSAGMLEALIDSVVSMNVAEICSLTWDSVLQSQRDCRKRIIKDLTAFIYNDLVENHVIPGMIDVELLLLRCRAAEAFKSKNSVLHQTTFAVINDLENELLEETVSEAFMEAKCLNFVKRKWMKKFLRKKSSVSAFNWKKDLFDSIKTELTQPVHLVFIDDHPEKMYSLIEPLVKANPPNPLAYLQSFAHFDIKMIWSDNSVQSCPFTLSHLTLNSPLLDLFNIWPPNYPGPTVLILPGGVEVNFSEFPWKPQIIAVNNEAGGANSERFREIFEVAFRAALRVELPILNQNLKFSDLIPDEFIKSFVDDFLDTLNDENFVLRSALLSELVERIFWTLFRSPQATRLLSWHPLTAGRSAFLDSLRKASMVPEKFVNLLQANESFETTAQILDSIFGTAFTCNLESLYTNQSISELIRSQNQVLKEFSGHLSKKSKLQFIASPENNWSFDDLNDKLKSEASQSEAYESFLKKFL